MDDVDVTAYLVIHSLWRSLVMVSIQWETDEASSILGFAWPKDRLQQIIQSLREYLDEHSILE